MWPAMQRCSTLRFAVRAASGTGTDLQSASAALATSLRRASFSAAEDVKRPRVLHRDEKPARERERGDWEAETLRPPHFEGSAASLAEDMTNRKLKKAPPGASRARKLFDTFNLVSSLEEAQKKRPKGMPRFNVRDFEPDDSLHFEEGPIQTIINEGVAEREDKRQRQRKAEMKAKALKARERVIGDDSSEDPSSKSAASSSEPAAAAESEATNKMRRSGGGRRRGKGGNDEGALAKQKEEAERLAAGAAGNHSNTAAPARGEGGDALDHEDRQEVSGGTPHAAGARADENGLSAPLGMQQAASALAVAGGAAVGQRRADGNARPIPDLAPSQMADWISRMEPPRPQRVRRRVATPPVGKGLLLSNPTSGSNNSSSLQELLQATESADGVLAIVAGMGDRPTAAEALQALQCLTLKLLQTEEDRAALATDQRVLPLLHALHQGIEDMPPRALSDTLSVLMRLRATPSWLPKLVEKSVHQASSFDTRSLATMLVALAAHPTVRRAIDSEAATEAADEESTAKTRKTLRRQLQSVLRKRAAELSSAPPLETVAICRAIGQLRIGEASTLSPLVAALRRHVQEGRLGAQDLASGLVAASSVGLDSGQATEIAQLWLEARQNVTADEAELLQRAVLAPNAESAAV